MDNLFLTSWLIRSHKPQTLHGTSDTLNFPLELDSKDLIAEQTSHLSHRPRRNEMGTLLEDLSLLAIFYNATRCYV